MSCNVVHAVTVCLMKSWKPPATTSLKEFEKIKDALKAHDKRADRDSKATDSKRSRYSANLPTGISKLVKRRTYYGAVSTLAREFGPQMWLSRWARSLHTFQGDLFSPTFVHEILLPQQTPLQQTETPRTPSPGIEGIFSKFPRRSQKCSFAQGWMQNTDNELMKPETSRSLDFLDPDLIRTVRSCSRLVLAQCSPEGTSLSKTLFDALRVYRRNVQPQIGSKLYLVSPMMALSSRPLRHPFSLQKCPPLKSVLSSRAQYSSSSPPHKPCFISFS